MTEEAPVAGLGTGLMDDAGSDPAGAASEVGGRLHVLCLPSLEGIACSKSHVLCSAQGSGVILLLPTSPICNAQSACTRNLMAAPHACVLQANFSQVEAGAELTADTDCGTLGSPAASTAAAAASMVGLPAVLHHAFLDDYLQHACEAHDVAGMPPCCVPVAWSLIQSIRRVKKLALIMVAPLLAWKDMAGCCCTCECAPVCLMLCRNRPQGAASAAQGLVSTKQEQAPYCRRPGAQR